MTPEPSVDRLVKRPQAWLVAALVGIICLFNFLWLSYDRTPPHWDFAGHLQSAMSYRALLADFLHGNFRGQQGFVDFLRRFVHVDSAAYPPLFPLTAGLVSPTMSLRSLCMVNSLFVAILAFSVYQIGRRLHSSLAGLLSVVLILAYPIAIHMSHDFMVDYALLAMTALSGFFLIASDEFRSPRETYLFGISAGLGMLTKPTFASFILVPACYTLARALARAVPPQGRRAQWRVLARLGLALLLGAFLAALWYWPNRQGVYSEATRIAASNPIGFDVFDVNALVYYLNVLVVDQIGWPFAALLVFGLIVLRKRLSLNSAGLLLSWLVGIFALATLAPYKGLVQDIGILVPVSVISGVALAGMTRLRRITFGAVVLYAAVQTTVFSLPFPIPEKGIRSFRWAVRYYGFASLGDWQIERALKSLGEGPLTIWVTSDQMYFNGVTFQYYVRSLGLPFKVRERYEWRKVEELLGADAIIFKSNWVPYGTTRGMSLRGVSTEALGVMYTTGRTDLRDRPDEPITNIRTRRDRELEAHPDWLQNRRLSQRLPLPDGSELLVYR